MTAALVVRHARIDDRPQVWPLARALATTADLEHPAFDRSFTAVVDGTGASLLVAEVGDVVVGYLLAQCQLTFHANGSAVWVQELFVHPDHRRAGVGRALMEAAERWAESQDCVYVALATRRAADFYTALGYEASATYLKRTVSRRSSRRRRGRPAPR